MKKSCSNCAHMLTYIGVDMCDRPGISRPRPVSIEADKAGWKGLKLATCGDKLIFWEAKRRRSELVDIPADMMHYYRVMSGRACKEPPLVSNRHQKCDAATSGY